MTPEARARMIGHLKKNPCSSQFDQDGNPPTPPMKPDDLIQAMRLLGRDLQLLRTRLMLIEDSDPAGYLAICNLFAPIPENKQRWNPKVKAKLTELRKGLAK